MSHRCGLGIDLWSGIKPASHLKVSAETKDGAGVNSLAAQVAELQEVWTLRRVLHDPNRTTPGVSF